MMVGDSYFCEHVKTPTAGKCWECDKVRAKTKPKRKLAHPSNSKSEDTLDDTLERLLIEYGVSGYKGHEEAIMAWHKAEVAKLFEQVDRIEVIDDTGRVYVKGSIYGSPVKVELSLQDDNRTLKVFVKALTRLEGDNGK